jgi:iron complex transport system substrate-binding protein
MKLRKVLTFATVCALSFGLVACGAKETKEESTSSETRVIEHAMGETEIKGEPEKIVILTNEGTEALLALGVKPVGAVQSWTGNPWYSHIEKNMEGVKNLGLESQVNLEEIAALQPDLIIGNKMRHEDIYKQLSQIAPTVYSETLRGEWKNNFEFYAEVLNKEEEGKKLIDEFDSKAKAISEKAKDKLDTKLSIVRFMPGKTRVYLENSFAGIILDQIGFARTNLEDPSGENFALEIGKERLQEADGDAIVYFTYDQGDGQGTQREQEWLKDPLFNNLNAVKNGQVFKVDDAIWNTAGGIKAANLMLEDLNNLVDKLK